MESDPIEGSFLLCGHLIQSIEGATQPRAARTSVATILRSHAEPAEQRRDDQPQLLKFGLPSEVPAPHLTDVQRASEQQLTLAVVGFFLTSRCTRRAHAAF